MSLSTVPPVIAAKPIKAHPSRRCEIRVATNFPVTLVFSNGASNVIPARSVDIGMGGICVETATIIDYEAVRAVRIPLGKSKIDFDVRPRWSLDLGGSGGPVTGLTFASVDDAKKNALWDLIQERGCELGMFLSGCEGLDQLNFEEALDLALSTRLRIVRRGDLIYTGCDERTAASICLLMSGSVVLEPSMGRMNQRISMVKPREIFGGLPTCLLYTSDAADESSSG